jgi:DNA repair protein RadD
LVKVFQLREYQQRAVDSAWQYLCTRTGNPAISSPTGSGKSVYVAELARRAVKDFRGRVVVLQHRKELIEQNAEKVRAFLPDVSVGIYSAGLKSKDLESDVILAGIQSVYRKGLDLGQRHLVIVDEAHLVPASDDGMYQQFLSDLRMACPKYRMVGLTATPYRLENGLIYGHGKQFDDLCCEIGVAELINAGYLCPITSQPVTEVDTSGLKHRGGEFVRGTMESLFESHVTEAIDEIWDLVESTNRRSVLVFCSGVNHAEHAAEYLTQISGQECGVVTGDTLPIERAGILARFGAGDLRFVFNVDVLTTGFDAPRIDCIAALRATESAGLWAQMLGRGLRKHPSKEYCLVLDFGGNLQRHGPIDAPDYGKREKPKSGGSDAPVKVCPNCQEECPLSARECSCGFLFPAPKINHESTADSESAVLMEQLKPERWLVTGINWAIHTKVSGGETSRTLRVDYQCEPEDAIGGNLESKVISEWVCLEHEGFARTKAMKWWQARSLSPVPETIDEAITLHSCLAVADTTAITTKKEGKYYRIIKHELGELPEDWFVDDANNWEEAPF